MLIFPSILDGASGYLLFFSLRISLFSSLQQESAWNPVNLMDLSRLGDNEGDEVVLRLTIFVVTLGLS